MTVREMMPMMKITVEVQTDRRTVPYTLRIKMGVKITVYMQSDYHTVSHELVLCRTLQHLLESVRD